LKLIEEPPPNCLLLLVCNQPGRLLRTIRSRCMRIDLQPLTNGETMTVLAGLALDEAHTPEAMEIAVKLSAGSPGRALAMLESSGAKSFAAFLGLPGYSPGALVEFGNRFTAKSTSADDFEIFCELLEGWVGTRARQEALHGKGHNLAEAFSAIGHSIRQTNALNLDRRQTVIHALSLIDDALRMA
jgi:DNA polymerase-3 subunit delta'